MDSQLRIKYALEAFLEYMSNPKLRLTDNAYEHADLMADEVSNMLYAVIDNVFSKDI